MVKKSLKNDIFGRDFSAGLAMTAEFMEYFQFLNNSEEICLKMTLGEESFKTVSEIFWQFNRLASF